MTAKRVNKSKEEIAHDMKIIASAKEKIALVKRIFPLVKGQKTIYEAQTVLYGLYGYIKGELQKRERAATVEELALDFSKEKDYLDVITTLHDEFKGEKAWAFANLLNEFADSFQKYGAMKYLENPMDVLKEEDIIA